MNNRIRSLFSLLAVPLCLSGCSSVGEKSGSIAVIYLAAAIISLALLLLYLRIARRKNLHYLILFVSVLTVNLGYYLLSVSPDLGAALWANRLSYLGSVFLPIAMLCILTDTVYGTTPRKLSVSLHGIALVMFLLAASPGYSSLYYREVSLIQVNGASVLSKVYGPLHCVYFLYLFACFAAMIAIIVSAVIRRKVPSPLQGLILTVCVFMNLAVWLLEQLVSVGFEILSISYIMTEGFLLCLLLLVQENEHLQSLITQASVPEPPKAQASEPDTFRTELFTAGLLELTPAERGIYQLYLQGKSTREILSELHITENTLKYHNRNLYSKLGVSSRKELIRIARILDSESEVQDA